jgi:hypothetical protein
VTQRRTFLATLGAAGAFAWWRPTTRAAVPVVAAVPTVLHAHPEGQTTLVRFTAIGVDAEAGRLRVHDARTARLLGTAGVIRRGNALVGELRLPLARRLAVRSDLEVPGTRRVHRTVHQLEPTPRWTIQWVTLAEPGGLAARFVGLHESEVADDVARLTAAGVRLNPWSAPAAGRPRDHLDLLRVVVAAARASRVTGIPLSAQALVPEPAEPFLAEVLAGAGVAGILPGDGRSDPVALGFTTSRGEMARRLEAWLGALGAGRPATAASTALIVDDDPDLALQSLPAVEDWNATWAFPRILIGTAGTAGTAGTTGTTGTTGAFAVLARVVSPERPTLEGIAARAAFPVAGALVFNPSPFGRSDVLRFDDGTLRVVTDVPGLGYVFVPETKGIAAIADLTATGAIETAQFAVQLDRESGAIVSLVERGSGMELVAPEGALNDLTGTVVSDVRAEWIAGVGRRLLVRRATRRGIILSRVTAYEALPWVDIENEPGGGEAGEESWRFAFRSAGTTVAWEVAGGRVERVPPVEDLSFLRWLGLGDGRDTLLVGRDRPGVASVGADGTVVLRAGPPVRFRIALHRGYLLADDPWRFGFGLRPLAGVPTTGRGDMLLPTFGRMLDVADPMVAVAGVCEADDGVGVTVWLQDLAGASREVVVRPGVLSFGNAILIDLAERDREPARRTAGGAITVPLPASGYAAVRLLGVRLSG